MIGTSLSHYNIVEKLGSGGMGEVFVAEDTELGRQVALKVLPPEMAESEERRARFRNEARAIAALNHPNIVTVYSVEEADGVHFMTMELVRGRCLSELQPNNGFALGKFLEVAIPLADAVGAAHQGGITHRDLKPDNVMLGDDGRVKVLDFGLAKTKAGIALEAAGSELDTRNKTAEGQILGTVAYMSPEQAEGKAVDERSDIFSLGIVLYEMVTGRRPFEGDTPASTLSAILKDTPPPASELNPSAPRDLARVLRRCLIKDPDRRYQSCKDVRNELEELKQALSTGELQASDTSVPARARVSLSWLIASAAALLVIGAGLGALLWSPGRATDSLVPRLDNPVQITSAIGLETSPSWSPEAGRIAYVSDQTGNRDIWVSQVSGGAAINLTADHTGLDDVPRWSPDGSQIAFGSHREGGGCFLMPALGGTARRIAEIDSARGQIGISPFWSADGSRLGCADTADGRVGLQVLDVATREVERLFVPGQYSAIDNAWSPDGRFLAHVDAITDDAETTQLWVTSFSGESSALTDGTTEVRSPVWRPDGTALMFISNRGRSKDLWIQKLNEDAEPEGAPRAITTGLGLQSASLSADGSKIAYSKGGRFSNVWRAPLYRDRPATWADAEQLTFDQAFIGFIALSPDGTRLAVSSTRGGSQDLWTLSTDGGDMKPLTDDPAPDWSPAWSPDGNEIAFYTSRTGNREIFVVSSEGGPMRQLTTHAGGDMVPAWSPDGERIAYTSARGSAHVLVMTTTGEPLLEVAEHAANPTWSPDGNWIAFTSLKDSQPFVWRAPALGGEPEQMTMRPSSVARWSPDGETIYFNDLFGGGGFWARSLADGTERPVLDLSGKRGVEGTFSFAIDDGYLYFTWQETLGDIWIMDVVWD